MYFDFLKHYVFSRRAGSLVRIIGWISFAGSVLSVAALVVVISVMQGFGRGMRERLLVVEPHLVVKPATGSLVVGDLSRVEDITQGKAHLVESQDVLIRTIDGLYSGAQAQGIESYVLGNIMKQLDKDRVSRRKGATDLSARDYTEESYRLEKGEIAIGSDLANSLGVLEGDELTAISPEALLLPAGEAPKYEKLRVKTIIRANVPQFDASALFYGIGKSLRAIQYTGAPQRAIHVELENPEKFDEPKTSLNRSGFVAESWKDRNSALFYSLKVEKSLMTMALGIAFLVGSFSVVTLLLLLCTQKKFDVAVLQVMGLTADRVRSLFHRLGMGLVGLGTLVGFILGSIVCWWQSQFQVITLPDIYYDRELPIDFDMSTSLGVVAIVLLVSLITTRAAVNTALSHKLNEILRMRRA